MNSLFSGIVFLPGHTISSDYWGNWTYKSLWTHETINVLQSRLLNLRGDWLGYALNHSKTPLHGGKLVIANCHAVLTPSDSIACHKIHISRIASICSTK